MEEVLHNMQVQVPLWSAAVAGSPDWDKIYDGYASAVDWPTACFFRELLQKYPAAKFALTRRDPERWADSFGATIYKLLEGKQGWGPLCEFLGAPVPDEDFPRTNDREEFWDRVNGNA